MYKLAYGVLLGVMVWGCGGGGEPGADVPDGGTPDFDAAPQPDAMTPVGNFDHFGFEIVPTVPLVGRDFTVEITAYRSSDSSQVHSYDSTISVAVSSGQVSGQFAAQPLDNGRATITISVDAAGDDITLTATDDNYPAITDTSEPFRISPLGDDATALDVVISEVNWYGNGLDSDDEWIELRNTTGAVLNLSEWTIERAGTGETTVQLANGTEIDAGGYIVLGKKQGSDADGMRTSLTGVEGVQLHNLSLINEGEPLILKDPDGSEIDSTPTGAWAAGNNEVDYSMERRDDITGGGYGAGGAPASWYTWSSLDGTDTTSADSTDRGTPGAANSDPDIFDHFTLVFDPAEPRIDTDFTLTVTAYSSADDSVVIDDYNETVNVSASSGTLSGDTSGVEASSGVAVFTLQNDTVASGVTFTVSDAIYPEVTGSAQVTIRAEGDPGSLRDVVISEVNWDGNAAIGANDEWLELRNISGAELNMSGWTIDGAGSSTNAIALPSGTILADGAYLVLADRQGMDADGMRTSLTGVSNVYVNSSVALTNSGEQLTLRDIDGTLVDQTPIGAWPAGNDSLDYTMERRDNLTGGGYGDGSSAAAWYTWNPDGGTNTTHPDAMMGGTPGAANSDPDAFPPPLALPYASGFEASDPAWQNLGLGGFSNTPPAGTSARNGTQIITTTSLTLGYTRQLQSVDCITLNNDTDAVGMSIWAVASTGNSTNTITARPRVLWFTDAACDTPHGMTAESGPSVGTDLMQGTYAELTLSEVPPSGATHMRVVVQAHDDDGGALSEDWAADDVSVTQP